MYQVELCCFADRVGRVKWSMYRVLKEGLGLDDAVEYARDNAERYAYLLLLDQDGYSVDVREMFGDHELYCGFEYSSEYGVNEW